MWYIFLEIFFWISAAFGMGFLFGWWGRSLLGFEKVSTRQVRHLRKLLIAARKQNKELQEASKGGVKKSQDHLSFEADYPELNFAAASASVQKSKSSQRFNDSEDDSDELLAFGSSPISLEKPEPSLVKISEIAPGPVPKSREIMTSATKKPNAPSQIHRASHVSTGNRDPLSDIKGIGPKLVDKLYGIGIERFTQLANMSDNEAERFENEIGFPGRVRRERWREQALERIKAG